MSLFVMRLLVCPSRSLTRPAALGASLLAGLAALTLAWRATRDPGTGRDAWLPREPLR